jgi:DNA repair protein RecO (recombination protein O)
LKLHDSTALVLDLVDLHDRDRIVTLLTPQWGKRRGVARGARRRFSRYAGQLQPLSQVKVTWFEKDGQELVRLREVELVRGVDRLYRDLEGILVGAYVAEQAACFAQENEPSELLYRLIDSVTRALEAGGDRQVLARYVEVWTLRISGLFPATATCMSCGAALATTGGVLAGDGSVICRGCGQGEAIAPAVLAFLEQTARTPPAVLGGQSWSGSNTLERVEALCAQLRRTFLGHELRSYEVMKRTLAVPVSGP